MTSEFDLIRRFFRDATPARADVLLGIDDDCALLQPPPRHTLAVSTDTLVVGRHFVADVDPAALGHKALAVNLSDLAAMGATPAWVLLAISLPESDTDWLAGFMRGFALLAQRHGVQLVGGDTTRGPLSITVQVTGFLPEGAGLRRAGGRVGDRLFISGTLGDAALALRAQQAGELPPPVLQDRLDRPTPRVDLGLLLRDVAHSAVDVSDGLLADLEHLCEASEVGARLRLADLPLSPGVRAASEKVDWELPLHGGDDYELLFSVSPDDVDRLLARCVECGETIHEIGELVDGADITLEYPDGRQGRGVPHGYDHFRD